MAKVHPLHQRLKRIKSPCMCCGKMVSVRYARQNGGGGKQRVKHECPHGKPCWAGDPRAHGGGFNRSLSCEACTKVVRHIPVTRLLPGDLLHARGLLLPVQCLVVYAGGLIAVIHAGEPIIIRQNSQVCVTRLSGDWSNVNE